MEPEEEEHQEEDIGPSKPPTAPGNSEKRNMVSKLRSQNDKLKQELKMLTVKLEDFVENAKNKRTSKQDLRNSYEHDESQGEIKQKEVKLRKAQQRINVYKKEIKAMRS